MKRMCGNSNIEKHKSLISTCVIVGMMFLGACAGKENALQNALKMAGENGTEMEKVLNHFSLSPADSLKYRAARFLIENMPGHGGYYFGYKMNPTSSWHAKLRAELTMINHPDWCPNALTEWHEDLCELKADYLIAHIEATFKQKEQHEWLKEISFLDFCEFLLPYRIDEEMPILWRVLCDDNIAEQRKYEQFDDIRTSADYASLTLPPLFDDTWTEVANILPEGLYYKPDCKDVAYADLINYRLSGIPAAIDMIPYWGNMDDGHSWAQPIDRRNRVVHKLDGLHRIIPKVYRQTYSRRSVEIPRKEHVPSLFQNPFLIDVTSEYVYSASHVEEHGFGNARFGYLCVFSDGDWKPIAQARNHFGKCAFQDMGTGVVYLPVYYKGEKMVSTNAPFLLKTNGEKVYFRGTTDTETIKLHRKYPLESLHKELFNFFSGTLEASRFADFHESDTIGYLSLAQGLMAPSEFTLPGNEYIYFRITPTGQVVFINELSFLNDKEERIYGSPLQETPDGQLMQDGDILTAGFFMGPVAFAVPPGEMITKIDILPRNDGNGIYPGDEYELCYFDKGWISCGKQIAKSYNLVFDKIPKASLLLLRNLSNGKQERIFSYQSGRQIFY